MRAAHPRGLVMVRRAVRRFRDSAAAHGCVTQAHVIQLAEDLEQALFYLDGSSFTVHPGGHCLTAEAFGCRISLARKDGVQTLSIADRDHVIAFHIGCDAVHWMDYRKGDDIMGVVVPS